jgi:hypothetical protein
MASQYSSHASEERSLISSIALSYLSDVIRMAPPTDIENQLEAFDEILLNLEAKKEW